MIKIAQREVPTADAVIIASGVLMVIDLFLPWSQVSVLGFTLDSQNAFGSGFAAWFGALLVIAAAGVVAGRVFAGFALPTSTAAGPAVLLLALSGLGAVLILLRLLSQFGSSSIGLFLGLLLALVQAFFVFQAFKASGEAMPDFGRKSGGAPPGPPAA